MLKTTDKNGVSLLALKPYRVNYTLDDSTGIQYEFDMDGRYAISGLSDGLLTNKFYGLIFNAKYGLMIFHIKPLGGFSLDSIEPVKLSEKLTETLNKLTDDFTSQVIVFPTRMVVGRNVAKRTIDLLTDKGNSLLTLKGESVKYTDEREIEFKSSNVRYILRLIVKATTELKPKVWYLRHLIRQMGINYHLNGESSKYFDINTLDLSRPMICLVNRFDHKRILINLTDKVIASEFDYNLLEKRTKELCYYQLKNEYVLAYFTNNISSQLNMSLSGIFNNQYFNTAQPINMELALYDIKILPGYYYISAAHAAWRA